MSKARKLTAMLIAIVMVMGMMVPAFALGSDVVGTEFEDAAAQLRVLGIMEGDYGTGNFRPNDSIIRSEFAKIAVVALGLDDVAQTAKGMTSFADVVENHWASGYINVAAAQGIIIGDGDGNFRPDDAINYAEALTILVRLIGYKPVVENTGTWPINYLTRAAQLGITQDVPVFTNQDAVRGMVAKLMVNTLTVDVMTQIGHGANATYEVQAGKNLLTENLNIHQATGVVAGNEALNPSGVTLEEGQVAINGKAYNVGNTAVADLLGYKVSFYATANNEIIIVEEAGSTVVEFNSGEITDATATTLTQDDTDYDIEDAYLVFNGKVAALADHADKLVVASGNVTLVQNGDGHADFIFATSFETRVVNEVIPADSIVYFKGGFEELNYSADDATIHLVKDGYEIGFEDLNEYDVLAIAEAIGGDFAVAFVITDTVQGIIEEIDGGNLVINGSAFQLKNAISSENDESYGFGDTTPPAVGHEGIFKLDVDGNIVVFLVDGEDEQTDDASHVVVTAVELSGVVSNPWGTPYRELRVKVLNTAGDIITLYMAAEFTVDTDNYVVNNLNNDDTSADYVGNVLATDDVIAYTLNDDGNVATIENQTPYTSNVNNTFNANTNRFGSVRVNANTVIFNKSVDGDGNDVYAVFSVEDLVNEEIYDLTVYGVNNATGVAARLFIEGAIEEADAATTHEAYALIDRVTTAINSEGNAVDRLYAIIDGELVSYLATAKDIISASAGELIKVQFNENNELDAVVTEAEDMTYAVEGTVYRKTTTTITIADDENTTAADIYDLADTVYVYTVEGTDISVSSMHDVRPYNVTRVNASDVQAIANEDGLIELIIIVK